MKALDWFVLAVMGTGTYLLLKRFAAPGQPGRTFYAAAQSMRGPTAADLEEQEMGRAMRAGVTDWNAPGNTNFNAPPPGFVWDEPFGAYVTRNADGVINRYAI